MKALKYEVVLKNCLINSLVYTGYLEAVIKSFEFRATCIHSLRIGAKRTWLCETVEFGALIW